MFFFFFLFFFLFFFFFFFFFFFIFFFCFYVFFFFFFFFFFQAEDGIRDRDVTGVQTCALPISFAVRSPPTHFTGKPTLNRTVLLSRFVWSIVAIPPVTVIVEALSFSADAVRLLLVMLRAPPVTFICPSLSSLLFTFTFPPPEI